MLINMIKKIRNQSYRKGALVNIRVTREAEFDKIWPIFHEIAAPGETYACPRDISKDEAERLRGCFGHV